MNVAVQALGQYFSPFLQQRPDLTPLTSMHGYQLLRLQYGVLQPDEVVRTPWAIHYLDALDVMPVYDLEFAFPIDIDNPVAAVEAIRKVVQITEEYAEGGKAAQECQIQRRMHMRQGFI